MTDDRMALSELLQKSGDGDFLRSVAEAVLQILMEADVEGLIGAGRHERSADRLNYRNGYRERSLDTRLGSLSSFGWWIDPESGLPIPERAGVLRYFIRVAEKIEWADRPEDLAQNHPGAPDLPPGIEPPRPISVTFVPATVFDNPALLRVNPEYLAWLLSLPTLERERLLGGNWKIRPAAGLYFQTGMVCCRRGSTSESRHRPLLGFGRYRKD